MNITINNPDFIKLYFFLFQRKVIIETPEFLEIRNKLFDTGYWLLPVLLMSAGYSSSYYYIISPVDHITAHQGYKIKSQESKTNSITNLYFFYSFKINQVFKG